MPRSQPPSVETVARGVWPVAIVAAASMAISFFDRQTFSVLAPRLTARFHISNAEYGWLGSAFSWAYLLGSPIAGRVVQRVGARRALLVALIVWSSISGLHAFAPSLAVFFALRIGLGLAESPSFPAAVLTVRRVLPDRQLTRGVSLVFLGISIGALLASPLATLMARLFDWRAAFLGTAGVAALWLPVWVVLTSRAPIRALLDERRGSDDRNHGGALRHPEVVRALIALAAVMPMSAFCEIWEAKFWADHLHVSEVARGGYLMVSPIAYDLGVLLFADLATRAGDRRRPFVYAVALAAVGAIALGFLRAPPLAAVCMALGGAGRGGLFTLLLGEMAANVPTTVVSAASGFVAGLRGLIAALVSPLIGHSLGRLGYPGVVILLGAWVVPGCAAWLAWDRLYGRLAPGGGKL